MSAVCLVEVRHSSDGATLFVKHSTEILCKHTISIITFIKNDFMKLAFYTRLLKLVLY